RAQIRAVRVRLEDVVAEERPRVDARVGLRRGRALGAQVMGRRVEDLAVAGEEVRAGRASLAGRDEALVRAVGVHDEDLVALEPVALADLEDELRPVPGPVGLR